MSKVGACPVCSSTQISTFFEVSDMPVHIGIQWSTLDAACNCPKGDIRLAFCNECGFIANLAFEPALVEYSQTYDNSLYFSPFFRKYAHSLAQRLIERHDIRGKDVIEIGCGKGDFLVLLCELGNNRGVGFDPSYEGQRLDSEVTGQITFIRDFYSEKYSDYKADLICCRYVFEHIPDPVGFLQTLRRTVGDRFDTVVFFEVPDVLFVLRDLSVWDIIYEHCSYFSADSLAYTFALCGFDVCEQGTTYQGQYLTIDALPARPGAPPKTGKGRSTAEMTRYVARFAEGYREKLSEWRHNLERMERKGQRAVAWGAGAKGVSFLNMLKVQELIGYIVDVNPYKQGKYLAGTGQQIVSPDFLRDYRPDVVLVMNPIYVGEIRQAVAELGLAPEFLAVS